MRCSQKQELGTKINESSDHMSSRLTAGLKNWGVGACPGAPACFLDHLHSMIGTKSFRNAKSHAAEHGLVLLGVIFFVAVSAPGLLAQTNALPAGAVNAQPPAGEPSTHITGSPGFGLPGGAPSSAIIGSPKTGLPAGVPFSAIMGSPTTWRPVRSPAGAMVGTPFTDLPGGAGSRTNLRSPFARLTKPANPKPAPGKSSPTNLLQSPILFSTNHPVPRAINPVPSTNNDAFNNGFQP
jgi:hypothetical protein